MNGRLIIIEKCTLTVGEDDIDYLHKKTFIVGLENQDQCVYLPVRKLVTDDAFWDARVKLRR